MNKRPQIAIFLSDLAGGGAESVMLGLAKEFDRRGITVELILGRARGRNLSRLGSSYQVSVLGASGLWRIPKLALHLRRSPPRLLLSALTEANLVAVMARQLSGRNFPLVLSERTTLSVRVQNLGGLLENGRLWLAKRLYPSADHIVAVSDGVATDVVALTQMKAEQVTPILNPLAHPELLNEVLPPGHPCFPPDSRVVLGVGRLAPPKDFPTLLRAFARLQEQDLRLVILGEGKLRPHLERLARELGIADRFSLPGHVGNPMPYFKAASVFALSSAWEGCPNSLIEALACGCPVVSTDCQSGPREILSGGEHGSLVPPGDHVSLACALQKTLDNPPNSENLRSRAADFSLDGVAEQYLEVLRPLLENSRSL